MRYAYQLLQCEWTSCFRDDSAFAYQVNGRRIDVNLYAASSVEVELDKKTRVSMTQETDYPIDGQIRIVVEPEDE